MIFCVEYYYSTGSVKKIIEHFNLRVMERLRDVRLVALHC